MTQEYPLQWPAGWPRAKSRKEGKFRGRGYTTTGTMTFAQAEARVRNELELLAGVRSPIVSSNVIRDRQPEDPGVAVYFQARDQPMRVIAIDIYTRAADNLAAIAATIEAMRAIERHGGAQIMERAFTGFDALPPPRSPWEVLGLVPGSSRESIEFKYRELARKHHPDRGGNAIEFDNITKARAELLAIAT